MNREEIKTPEDILEFMKEHVKYGWRGNDDRIHIEEMENFRKEYQIQSVENTINYGFGTCVEQVVLMHTLMDALRIKNKMYCCRIFEPDDYGNFEEEEHMHCFLLYEQGNKVYHMEHANKNTIGIYQYEDENSALHAIEAYYENIRGGKLGTTTEFFEAKPGISFQKFNQYVNALDKE